MSESNLRPSPDSLVREVIARWRGGEQPDARAFLEAHPEIQQRKTLAIDLIYEEYCLRQEQGETCVASTFCNRFPSYKQSLARMLDVHTFMAAADSTAAAWPELGSEFLGFEIVEQIGAGAVAKVYLARETDVGSRQVVIKVSRFGRGEARLLGKLTHPGVVPIHSVREDPLTGMTCICMPFLGTATLVDILDEAFPLGTPPASARIISRLALGYLPAGIDPAAWGPVDPFFAGATYAEGIVHLGRQIVTALAKAHQAGITHRDIKPSNVLLARDGRPMLLDFNLSTEEQLPADRVGGTLAYMAPEQLEALSGNLTGPERASDPRSDLYSVGAMLFELLTGKLPSRPLERAGKQPGIAEWIECRRNPPPSAREHNPAVEPALDAILQRALAPRPIDRYGSAEKLAGALDALLLPRVRLLRKVRDRRRWIFAGGSLVAAAGLGGGWYWWTLPPLPVRLYEAGLRAFDRQEFAAAEDLFTRSIQAGNDSIEVYFARGQTRRQLEDFEGENEDFAKVTLLDAGRTGVGLIHGAHAGDELNHPSQSRSLLMQAQQQGWNTVSVANSLGIAHSKSGFPEVGAREIDRILAEYPKNETAQYNRALCWKQHTDSERRLVPPTVVILDAVALAAANSHDLEIIDLTAKLLSNAAGADPRYEDAAAQFLEAAESLGARRESTLRYWRKFTENPPAPKQPLTEPKSRFVRSNWRQTPPPDDPRLDRCLELLRADDRLTVSRSE
ncbi:MAG TPA: serine/threonine-protein kinase [Pirellulaceae bacterium]|nr:serine/threonine-protein kinase [Pirellulaceae bacterium]